MTTRTGFVPATTDSPGLRLTVPGAAQPPTVPQFDGVFDVVNGSRRSGFRGEVLLFNRIHCIAANRPVAFFDYNGNGGIDFADVVWLFSHL